jgi:hypothetical protein
MASELRVKTTVLPGHRVEVVSPELREGAAVEVVIQAQETELPPRPTIPEILASLPIAPRVFDSPEDVDRFLKEERDSWDR